MPAQPLGPTGLLAQSMTLPAGSQSLSMGGMGLRAQGMDGRKKSGAYFQARVLLVGGGGGGGYFIGGGGGSGGVLDVQVTLAPNSYAVVVGLGGAKGTTGAVNGAAGGDTSAFGLTAFGGRGGRTIGGATISVERGGSGGGGSGQGGGDGQFSLGTTGQGNNGGPGPGGGGGPGGPGLQTSYPAIGNSTVTGGAGVTKDISGSNVVYGGGGGQGGNDAGGGGYGFGLGQGRGGNGAQNGPGANGLYPGGGGGGGSGDGATNYDGGNGGSGVFIFSYASPTQLCTGGTVTSYLNGSTRWWVHTFTSNGTLVVP